jgi:hypothetical protein
MQRGLTPVTLAAARSKCLRHHTVRDCSSWQQLKWTVFTISTPARRVSAPEPTLQRATGACLPARSYPAGCVLTHTPTVSQTQQSTASSHGRSTHYQRLGCCLPPVAASAAVALKGGPACQVSPPRTPAVPAGSHPLWEPPPAAAAAAASAAL